MITIIHPFPIGKSPIGGIETWILDFISFASSPIALLGVSQKSRNPGPTLSATLSQAISIANIPESRKLVPNLLRYAWGLALNRKRLNGLLVVHRLELVPILRALKPHSKIVLFIHTNLEANIKKGSDSIWARAPWVYKRIEKFCIRGADAVYTYSSVDSKRISAIRPDVQLLEAWYNDKVFRSQNLPRERKVLWVGRFEEVKDPILALRIAKELSTSDLNKLLMVGEGSLSGEMQAFLSKHQLSRVEISAPKSQAELAELFNTSAAVLHTSHFEGAPRILLEAAACGVRPVTCEASDPEKVAEFSGGEIAKSRSAAAFVQALRAVMAKPPVHKIGQKVLSRGASFVIGDLERQLLALENRSR